DDLEALAGSHGWFGSGSLILITGKDRQLLIAHGVEKVYDVELLHDDEAMEVFNLYAFNHKQRENNEDPYGRLTWVCIEGLPILARSLQSVKRIASNFGKILEVGRLDFDSNVLPPVRSLILTKSMGGIGQSMTIRINGKPYPIRIDESSCFEEEFVGPSMDEHGDASSGMHSPKGWENEKTPATQSPRSSGLPLPPPDHYPAHSNSNVEFVKPTPEVNSIGHVSSLDHVIPEVDILRPIPDLNNPPSQDKEISPNDLDLDELISNFQRISDTADKVDAANKDASDVGGIRRKRKEKKKKLVVGSLCSKVMTSQWECPYLGDEVKTMEAIGEQIGFCNTPKNMSQRKCVRGRYFVIQQHKIQENDL
ncbi:nucleotide-binding alpha-beta plait domain-containing protein, partial [Tanacetum coccineum]